LEEHVAYQGVILGARLNRENAPDRSRLKGGSDHLTCHCPARHGVFWLLTTVLVENPAQKKEGFSTGSGT
jgi:hypothetical protein